MTSGSGSSGVDPALEPVDDHYGDQQGAVSQIACIDINGHDVQATRNKLKRQNRQDQTEHRSRSAIGIDSRQDVNEDA